MNDQPPVAESSVQDRLTAYFGGGQQKVTPTVSTTPVAPAEIEPEAAPEQPVLETAEAESAPPEEQSEQEPAVPTEEVDWEGKKYLIPTELKSAFMAQADYTRKTQELAEVRRSIEAEKLAVQSAQLFNQQIQPLLDQKAQLKSVLEQAKKIDWTQLTTDQKIDLDRELRNVNSQLTELDSQIGAKQQEHSQEYGRAVLQAVQATDSFMAQKVPGWNQSTGNALHEYGLGLGLSKQTLTAGVFSNPTLTHALWKAQQWDNLQAGKPALANKVAKAVPVVRQASADLQKSQSTNQYKVSRDRLRKSGSIEDFASALLASQRQGR